MLSTRFLQLQALLVVAGIRSSFGGSGDECFGEGKWVQWLGMEVGTKRFVAKGRSGMCLAVEKDNAVDFSTAVDACAASFHDGKLLSNDSWDAFVKARTDYTELSKLGIPMYVGFSPQPEKGCFWIDSSLKATLEDPCKMTLNGFVCEYPRQTVCRWELMTNENATKDGGGQWQLETVVMQLQEVDGSEKSCMPSDVGTTVISDQLATCKPLFNETWSQWSDCGSCGNQPLQGNQSRHQDLTDQCNKIASGVQLQRNHIRTCFQVPCSSTHFKPTPTSEGGPQFSTFVYVFGSLLGVLAIATTVVICCRYKGRKKKNQNISAGFEADSTSRRSGSIRGRTTGKEKTTRTRTRTKTTTREETSPVSRATPKRHHSHTLPTPSAPKPPAPKPPAPKPSAPKPTGGKRLGKMEKKVAQPEKDHHYETIVVVPDNHYETIVVVPEKKCRKGREKIPVQSDKYETIAGFGEMPAAKTGQGKESRTALVVAGKELERQIEQQEDSLFRRADEVKGLKIRQKQLQERIAKNTKK